MHQQNCHFPHRSLQLERWWTFDLSLGSGHRSHTDLPPHPLLQVHTHTRSHVHIVILVFASLLLTETYVMDRPILLPDSAEIIIKVSRTMFYAITTVARTCIRC